MDKAKRREYQARQKYRRIPLDAERWQQLGVQAKDRDMTRTALAALYLRSAIDSGGEFAIITARPKPWVEEKEDDGAQSEMVREREAEDAEHLWLAEGADLLHGPSVIRRPLRE
jgi:hypothetical protein